MVKITLFFSIMSGLVFIAGLCSFVYMHEKVHVEIYRHYAIESHIEYFSHFPDVVTVVDGDYSKCTDNCKLANNINEAISYPLFVVFAIISMLLTAIIIQQEIGMNIELIKWKHLNT